MDRTTSHCRTCGRTLNGALCCPDCGTPTERAHDPRGTALAPAPGPGPLPPAVRQPDDGPSPTPQAGREGARPEPRSRRGRNAVLFVAVAAALAAGVTTLTLHGTDDPSDAAPPHPSVHSPHPGPATRGGKLPTGSPSPKVGGSDPEPAVRPTTHSATPPPPAPTPTPARSSPDPQPSTAHPHFSFPDGFPTPSGCAYTRWC